jgi:RNA polymerase sigma-70 factor (ECF subfamily)
MRARPLLSQAMLPASAEADVRAERANGLVLAHHDFIWRVLRRLGVPAGEVDDATQQVFWIAVRKINLEPSAADLSFLMAIAVRVAADSRRAHRRRREVSLETQLDGATSAQAPDRSFERHRALQVVEAILDELPFEQRVVFVLFELEEKSTEEIAAMLEIPTGTAASRLRRARAAFGVAVTRYRARQHFEET